MNKKLVWLVTPLLLLTVVAFAIARAFAEAQQSVKVHKVGLLLGGSLLPSSSDIEAFRQGLRELGYVEGRNIAIDYRVQKLGDRLVDLAAELVRLKVDVIVATSTGPALSAQKVTKTIPIVFAGAADPVASGLVASFARPGGNATGLTQLNPDLGGKRLELLKEVVPRLSRVAVLWHSDGPGQKPQMDGMKLAADVLRLDLQPLDARGTEDFEGLFHAAANAHADAVVALSSPRFTSQQAVIVRLAAEKRLPAAYVSSDWVEADGLMSYGANSKYIWRRAAYYVDKILKGVKPTELPVEHPTKFELVINLKTAKQIGLTIPPNVLARADRVIK